MSALVTGIRSAGVLPSIANWNCWKTICRQWDLTSRLWRSTSAPLTPCVEFCKLWDCSADPGRSTTCPAHADPASWAAFTMRSHRRRHPLSLSDQQMAEVMAAAVLIERRDAFLQHVSSKLALSTEHPSDALVAKVVHDAMAVTAAR